MLMLMRLAGIAVRGSWLAPWMFWVSCGGSSDGVPPPGDAAPPPAALCDRPALHDVSAPTAVVGDGTPGSCTAAALQQAASGGGTIVFRCGPAPVTITVA